jgi:hypothetical protein
MTQQHTNSPLKLTLKVLLRLAMLGLLALLLLLLVCCELQIWLSDWASKSDPPETYIWTSHPWLLSLYLDCPSHIGVVCPSPAQQQAVRAAMRAGGCGCGVGSGGGGGFFGGGSGLAARVASVRWQMACTCSCRACF